MKMEILQVQGALWASFSIKPSSYKWLCAPGTEQVMPIASYDADYPAMSYDHMMHGRRKKPFLRVGESYTKALFVKI